MAKILIADDEESIRFILSRAIENMGHRALCVSDGQAALTALISEPIDAALVDIRMPSISGLEILNHAGDFKSVTHVIVMTAQDTMENAINSMKHGAFDYITKPFNLEEVSIIIMRALENARLHAEISRLKKSTRDEQSSVALIGKSKSMQDVFKTIGKITNQDVTVLVQGESGTGKEVVARAIHGASGRADKTFFAVNCSAIPDNLLESELFGYKKGAFTGADTDKPGCFELADGGTVFLDEIGDMPQALQVKLLRFLQDKTFHRVGDTKSHTIDVRVIAATHRNLKKEIREGRFREDLFFRLNVVPLMLPPLRERREDIRPLVDYFAGRYAPFITTGDKCFAPETLEFFEYQDWPGNVRELENAVKRVLVLSHGNIVTRDEARSALFENDDVSRFHGSLEDAIAAKIRIAVQSDTSPTGVGLYAKLLPSFERPLFKSVLEMTGGNQLKAASTLGINRNTLRKRIRELGM